MFFCKKCNKLTIFTLKCKLCRKYFCFSHIDFCQSCKEFVCVNCTNVKCTNCLMNWHISCFEKCASCSKQLCFYCKKFFCDNHNSYFCIDEKCLTHFTKCICGVNICNEKIRYRCEKCMNDNLCYSCVKFHPTDLNYYCNNCYQDYISIELD